MTPEEYVEEVLTLVEQIPPGRVMSYGAIAEYLRDKAGRGSARYVGTVLARYGSPVPWHRVVAANGRVVPGHEAQALRRLRAEGTPLRGDRVDMAAAAWWPPPPSGMSPPKKRASLSRNTTAKKAAAAPERHRPKRPQSAKIGRPKAARAGRDLR